MNERTEYYRTWIVHVSLEIDLLTFGFSDVTDRGKNSVRCLHNYCIGILKVLHWSEGS